MNLKTSLIASVVSMILIHNSLSYASEITPVFTPEQESRIGEIAADYMRAHPEILIQMSETLQQAQQEKQTRGLIPAALAQQARIVTDKGIPSWGAADSAVMVVEFFDYQCIWCSRLAPELEKIMKANENVRYYFMEWPVFGNRWPESLLAAKTGLQVWKEKGSDAYLKYHNGIYDSGLNEGNLTKDVIEKHAENMKFNKYAINEINATLTDVNDITTTIGLTGTPGVIIMPVKGGSENNTTIFAGVTEAETIQRAINKAQGK
ncbi:disulfide bond formation protein DsbA [Klebsiella michiganensis]|uniref:DsbA family protein n=1 Tax=Klebsiella michiganensis TaxID=1134687 RepID=UPI00094FC814|nr:thioredoxin domain-containing protein [Klebsiella michiganensis]OLP11570.1 disulfide bond formation protein DsbA [Klebsiella michiganensis]